MNLQNFNKKTINDDSLLDNYHVVRSQGNPYSWFSSFELFKIPENSVNRGIKRPPYPVLTQNVNVYEILKNLNKSDFLVYSTFVATGFLTTIMTCNQMKSINLKLRAQRGLMITSHTIGFFFAFSASENRLRGILDNGLRWKRKTIQLYDTTSEYEDNTFWKLFRQRI